MDAKTHLYPIFTQHIRSWLVPGMYPRYSWSCIVRRAVPWPGTWKHVPQAQPYGTCCLVWRCNSTRMYDIHHTYWYIPYGIRYLVQQHIARVFVALYQVSGSCRLSIVDSYYSLLIIPRHCSPKNWQEYPTPTQQPTAESSAWAKYEPCDPY